MKPDFSAPPGRTWKRRMREGRLLLSMLLHPTDHDPRTLYDLISTDSALGDKSLYLNFGYWKDQPATIDQASENLVDLLGRKAELSADDEVLDVGFGFGDQDVYWMERFSPRKIVGLNITPSQVEVARRRVAARGLADRIDLRCGSATDTPFAAHSFDKVLALECAFHFMTRERFFAEAFRVLRPGGLLAAADMVPTQAYAQLGLAERVGDWLGRRFWAMPKENVYTSDSYRDRLLACGFDDVSIVNITEHVIQPFGRYYMSRMRDPGVAGRMNPLVRIMQMGSSQAALARAANNQLWEYVLVVARKPAAAA